MLFSDDKPSASSALVPSSRELAVLRRAAARCRACPLWEHATQTVFGEGPRDAPAMLVGEQPGNDEDRSGRPFTGPSGRLLDELLAEAGLDRRRLFLTNAVKHFKHKERGGRARIHARPTRNEVRACRGWLEAELDAVRPLIAVALGATAAQAFLGGGFRLTAARGRLIRLAESMWCLPTWHPSAVLRSPDRDARRRARGELLEDLSRLARALGRPDALPDFEAHPT